MPPTICLKNVFGFKAVINDLSNNWNNAFEQLSVHKLNDQIIQKNIYPYSFVNSPEQLFLIYGIFYFFLFIFYLYDSIGNNMEYTMSQDFNSAYWKCK